MPWPLAGHPTPSVFFFYFHIVFVPSDAWKKKVLFSRLSRLPLSLWRSWREKAFTLKLSSIFWIYECQTCKQTLKWRKTASFSLKKQLVQLFSTLTPPRFNSCYEFMEPEVQTCMSTPTPFQEKSSYLWLFPFQLYNRADLVKATTSDVRSVVNINIRRLSADVPWLLLSMMSVLTMVATHNKNPLLLNGVLC